MDCPGGPDVITMVLISERGRHESQHYKKKFEDRAVIRVIEEGTMSHGSQVASRSWKRQENEFLFKSLQEECSPADTDFKITLVLF